MLEKIKDRDLWEAFYEYKTKNEQNKVQEMRALRAFIDEKRYVFWAEKIGNGDAFSYPKKVMISKTQAGKKRTVYVFSAEENYILKFISYLLREYDYLFAPNLYSFRKNKTVKEAFERILKIKNINDKYVYKVDINNYFNSVNVQKLLPMLEKHLHDEELFDFFEKILLDTHVVFNGTVLCEKKGILPGAPISAFLANLYINELDHFFYNKNIPYIRYSDDIIVFADTEQELDEYIIVIKDFIKKKELVVNPNKENYYSPHEKWEFLGFSYCNGVIDVGDIALTKLKAKMRRKTNALMRWASRKKLPREYAAKAFVKRFNAKLYDNPVSNELTWTRWYFPIINTTKSLKQIDEYMQYCIRVLATGKRTKKQYEFRYEDIKRLGYRNLVNEYYKSTEVLKKA